MLTFSESNYANVIFLWVFRKQLIYRNYLNSFQFFMETMKGMLLLLLLLLLSLF